MPKKNLQDVIRRSTQKPALDIHRITEKKPAHRQGKKTISGHFEPELSEKIKILGVKQKRSLQSILEEAMLDILKKYQ